jgi:hypothetical protein
MPVLQQKPIANDDITSYNYDECRQIIHDLMIKNSLLENELKSLRYNNANTTNSSNTDINSSTTNTEDAFDLLSFPVDVINQCLSYFTMKDLSKLDIAYTNHSKRTKILNRLSNNNSLIYDDVNLDDSFKFIDNFLAWVGSRGINILNLSIDIQNGSKYDDTYNIDAINKNLNNYGLESLPKLTDYGLISFSKHCTKLVSLHISGSNKITDASLICIFTKCSDLQSLQICYCDNITGTFLIEIVSSNLQACDISGCDKITDLIGIRSCSNLESLHIRCDNITDTGLIGIIRQCSNLQILDISFNKNVTDSSLIHVAKHCPSLRCLEIKECDRITDKGVIEIAKNSNLELFSASSVLNITDRSIISIARNCFYLEQLQIDGCSQVTDTGIIAIAKHCPNLQLLDISDGITDTGLIAIARKCKDLRTLAICGCQNISDNGLIKIAEKSLFLEKLEVHYCNNITDIGLIMIGSKCKYLEDFEITACDNITESGLTTFDRISNLQSLSIMGRVSDDISDYGI